MFRKTIKYVDYNGVQREEVYHFNISSAEATELEISTPGGVEAKAKEIIASQDGGKAMTFFKFMIGLSVGVKSPDGKFFRKSEQIRDDFFQTEAYSSLLMEMMTDNKFVEAFFTGIMPKVDPVQPPQ